MSPFSWQCQNPCRLSLAFIIYWRVVTTLLLVDILQQTISILHFKGHESTTKNKTDHSVWKNCARNCCQRLLYLCWWPLVPLERCASSGMLARNILPFQPRRTFSIKRVLRGRFTRENGNLSKLQGESFKICVSVTRPDFFLTET